MTFAEGHALVVGVGEYRQTRYSVPSTALDAQSIYDALVDPNVAGYPPEQVRLLRDHGATLQGIDDGLASLAAASPGSTVIVFYAGHGVVGKDGIYYLTAHDSLIADGQIDPATALSEPQLLTALQAIKTQKLLLLLNACFSGEAGDAGSLSLDSGGDAALGAVPSRSMATRVLATGEGRAVVTACRADQKSWYRNRHGMTFFGEALAAALAGRGADPRYRYIGLSDVYDYVFVRAKEEAAKLAKRPVQEAVINLTNGVGPFAVALAPQGGTGDLGLDGADFRRTLPTAAGLELIDPKVVAAAGKYERGTTFENVGVAVIDDRKVIDFGSANVRDVKFGDVAGRDITKITINATPAVSAQVESVDSLRAAVEQIKADVDRLADAAAGDRTDIKDELAKAAEAAGADRPRMLDKLEAARAILEKLGATIPAAVALGETVAVLIQRAASFIP